MLIFKLLASYLTLGVEPDPEAEAAAAAEAERIAAESTELPNLEEEEEEPAGGADDVDDPDTLREQLRAEKTARETAERNHREAAERLAAADRQRQQPPPGPTQEQQLFEQEEAILRNPQSTEQQRYWVNANRTLRDTQRMARNAEQNSRESADRAEWDRVVAAKPGIAKKYGERIERMREEIRAKGEQVPPRKILLKMMIGDDIVEGNVKTTKKAAAGDTTTTTTIARGKPPVQRSDVRGRSTAASEQEKRRARLANQII